MKALTNFISGVIAFLILTFPFSIPVLYMFVVSPLYERFFSLRYRYFPYKQDPDVTSTLASHFSYYNKLNDGNKRRFESRLMIFMHSKNFIAHNGLTLNNSMRILISASAIQLTFGLDYFTLKNFYNIHVYPESYHYRHSKVKFRGHVSEYGGIHLSWNNFEKGYLFPQDGVNLGLHELMHALKIYALQHHIDYTFYDNNETIEKLVQVEMVKLKTKKVEFLKNRLVHEPDEFIAVCAECFFELPQQFNTDLPELYAQMKLLLNQDPLRAEDPVLGHYSAGSFFTESAA